MEDNLRILKVEYLSNHLLDNAKRDSLKSLLLLLIQIFKLVSGLKAVAAMAKVKIQTKHCKLYLRAQFKLRVSRYTFKLEIGQVFKKYRLKQSITYSFKDSYL